LAALLSRWKSTNTGNWIKRADAYAESVCEAVLNVFDCWFDDTIFDSRFEAAIRSWAQQSPDMIRGLGRSGSVVTQIFLTPRNQDKADALARDLQCAAMSSNQDVVDAAL